MKNEFYTSLIVLALTIVFGVICLMVYLSKGNHYWIKKKLKIGALLLSFNAMASGAFGQEDSCYLRSEPPTTKVVMGPTMIYNNSEMKNTLFQLESYNTDEMEGLSEIDGSGFEYGFTYEYFLGWVSSIIFHLTFSSSEYEKTQLIEILQVAVDGESYLIPQKIDVNYEISSLNFDMYYKQIISMDFPLGFIGGFNFNIPLKYEVREDVYHDLPEGLEIENNHITYEGEINDFSNVGIGINLGIQYDIIFDYSVYITPMIGWKYSLTNLVSDSDWTISSWYAGVSLRYAFGF